ncbi:MAG TPA: transposase [Gammaproteobacteria bacterium]|nr:transposase [Gammaproteobacteria bacterium]
MIFWQFYFRLYPGTIKGPQIVEFLKALTRQIPGPLLIVWHGLKTHKSKVVRHYVEREDIDIQLELLPAYAPELNPVEFPRSSDSVFLFPNNPCGTAYDSNQYDKHPPPWKPPNSAWKRETAKY